MENKVKRQHLLLSKQLESSKKCNKIFSTSLLNLKKNNFALNRQINATVEKIVNIEKENRILIENNSKLEKEISNLQQNCDYMEQLLNDDRSIELFDSSTNSFSAKTMECVMNLSNCNVAHHKIPDVIKSVLALADKEPDRVPKRATIDSIVSAKAVITQKHLSNVLPSKQNLTLYTDETRKFGKTYNTYIATDENQSPYFLGLREMYNKSAQTAFDTLLCILQDLSDSVTDLDNKVGDKIVSNIVNTMSDRASTEKAFNNILEEYRKKILPTVTDGWTDLSSEQQTSLTSMHSFFCGLHLLVACAEVSQKCLLEYEKTLKENIGLERDDEIKSEYLNTSECATVRLIRAASKCLSRGGDEKSGCFSDFQAYLSMSGRRVKFIRFHGNRFNVIFLLAEVLYYHRNDVV
ncbi:uncharacterized protein LOC132751328 [Ruditapes philippinarum]|uniref:uncharacterized protein LOC132751328 n=1 Tax=Ruditapes philippinarum TaxID=129788 RepID=UPI00295A8213|nr:uncharacterized protein LOC132751328 [Ruditapes philippinarum]